jgi:flagellar hook protein FlgE
MSISSAMYTGLSGLNCNGEAMTVVGDNISNLNTVGFKYSQVDFADLMAQTIATGSGPGQVGKGAQISEITPVFSQGSLETSAIDTNMAITGTGFFMVRNSNSAQDLYTRDGTFALNSDSYLVNPEGYIVQGKVIDPTTGVPTGADVDIRIEQNYTAPKATTQTDLVLNLNSTAATADTYSSAVTVYDNLGGAHTLNLTYTKTANANEWEISANLDGNAITVEDTAGSGTHTPIQFDNTGTMTSSGTYSLDATGYNIGHISLNLKDTSGGSTTQYASSSVTNYSSQDGYGPGYLERVSVDNNGIITGHYSNGQTVPLYQLTLARFNATDKLHREGSNLYSETQESGVPLTGPAGTNGLGKVNGNSLEQSNVDLGNEFVHMIIYQRGFQANSRIITTTDTLMQDVLSLKQ